MHHTSNVYSIIGKNAKNHNNSIISCYNRVIYDVLTFCKYFRLGIYVRKTYSELSYRKIELLWDNF